MRSLILGTVLMVGCSDYDLHREDDVVGEPEEEEEIEQPVVEDEPEPDPEPEEDADIRVEPLALDFGSVGKDCESDPLTVTITNDGLGDLEIFEVELVGDGTSAFIHTGEPLVLAYEESATFDVSFLPTAWLSYDIRADIRSNDPDEGTVRVDIEGLSEQGPLYEEGFVQDYNEFVDVLWVVDNSGSMSDELTRIAANFEAFIAKFVELKLDYHIAVVTTDMNDPNDSGRFQGPVITASTPDPITEFTNQVDQGSTGSADEQGFAAVRTALTLPENSEFLREDAALSVIVVSDEDDSSSIGTSTFVDFLLDLKKDPEMVRFNGFFDVLPFDFFGMLGKYIDAVEATEGFYENIQTADFTRALEELSFTSAGLTVIFYLEEEPETLANMTVTVDGEEVVSDAENGWTYDPETNAIIFHGDAVPGPDESVVVSYSTAISCD